jgi:4-diphosphocytidyl-2-C-methyl-D-erythritol kinase
LFRSLNDIGNLADHLRNDFESSVFARYRQLAAIKQQLYNRGASLALMSGSGSALFGLFERMEAAIEARNGFTDQGLIAFL